MGMAIASGSCDRSTETYIYTETDSPTATGNNFPLVYEYIPCPEDVEEVIKIFSELMFWKLFDIWTPVYEYHNYLYKLYIKMMFNIYSTRFYRRNGISISGFLGRVGKRKKRR